jgi:hypothetical protein
VFFGITVPSGKGESSPPPVSTPGYRLRRDALRILAEKFEGRTLSASEAETLLARHATLEDSLQAVRRAPTRKRWSDRFGVERIIGEGTGMRQLRWLVNALVLWQLCLIAVFLFQIGFSINSGAWIRHLDRLEVSYLIALSIVLLALAWWWRYVRSAGLRSKRRR